MYIDIDSSAICSTERTTNHHAIKFTGIEVNQSKIIAKVTVNCFLEEKMQGGREGEVRDFDQHLTSVHQDNCPLSKTRLTLGPVISPRWAIASPGKL